MGFLKVIFLISICETLYCTNEFKRATFLRDSGGIIRQERVMLVVDDCKPNNQNDSIVLANEIQSIKTQISLINEELQSINKRLPESI